MNSWPGKLGEWLKMVLYQDRNGDLLSRLELRSLGHDEMMGAIETYDFNDDTPKTEVDEQTSLIMQRAQEDCDGHGEGARSYKVYAFFGDNEMSPTQSAAGRFESQNSEVVRYNDYEQGPSKPSRGTAEEFSKLQMDNNRTLVGIVVANTVHFQKHTEQLLTTAYARIGHLEAERIDVVKTIEEMYSKAHEREIEMKREGMKMDRQTEMWEHTKVLFPTIVNKLSGKNLLPVKTTPEEEILQTLMASLTPKQIDSLKETLSPAQLVGFAELYEIERKKNEERKEAKAKREETVSPAESGVGSSTGSSAGSSATANGGGANGNGTAN